MPLPFLFYYPENRGFLLYTGYIMREKKEVGQEAN